MAEVYKPAIKYNEFRKSICVGDEFTFTHEIFNREKDKWELTSSEVEVTKIYPHLVVLRTLDTNKRLTASFSDLLLNSSLKKAYGLEYKRIEKEKK